MTIHYTSIPTFAGPLCVAESPRGLCYVGFARKANELPPDWQHAPDRQSAATRQLQEYFSGIRSRFDLRLDLAGTEFQQRVWRRLRDIPYGSTTSYGALAAALDRPGAARAVGSANSKNAIAIVIPCHRVVAANGKLAGFAWGTDTKRQLLEFEARVVTH